MTNRTNRAKTKRIAGPKDNSLRRRRKVGLGLAGTWPKVDHLGEDNLAEIFRGFGQAVKASKQKGEPTKITFSVKIQDSKPTIKVEPKGNRLTLNAKLSQAVKAARERGITVTTAILSRPEMLSATEFARQLNTTRQTINEKRKRHEVIALKGPTRGYRYPNWQIRENGELLPEL